MTEAPENLHFHELQMRKPVTLLVVAMSICMAAGTIWFRGPWYGWALWLAMAAPGSWHYFRNTKWGVELTDDEIVTWFGSSKRRVPLANIDYVNLASWDEIDFRVVLKDGSKLQFNSGSLENRLAIEAGLRTRGIKVERT